MPTGSIIVCKIIDWMLVGRRKLRGERSAISIDESVGEGTLPAEIPAHRALSSVLAVSCCARIFTEMPAARDSFVRTVALLV